MELNRKWKGPRRIAAGIARRAATALLTAALAVLTVALKLMGSGPEDGEDDYDLGYKQ